MTPDAELLAVFKTEVEDQIDDLCRRVEGPPDRWRIDRLFQLCHNIKGAARIVGIDGIRDAAHALEDLFGAIRDGAVTAAAAAELARAGGGLLETCFASMETEEKPDVAGFRHRVSERICRQAETGTVAVEGREGEAGGLPDGGQAVDGKPASPADEAGPRSEETLRIGAEKLDALMGLASELAADVFRSEERGQLARRLVTFVAECQRRRPELTRDPDFVEINKLSKLLRQRIVEDGERAARISGQLQGSVRLMRMVRIDGLTSLLNRSMREATRQRGNRAELRILGGRTEVDRAMLAHLRDPLTHLVRNAVFHGIEGPEERRAKGKAEVGTVAIEAASVGSWVELTVSDDGQGIEPVKIREHAIRTGLVSRDEASALTDEAVLGLLMRPGFSTAASVNEVAGRGVGLDVARSNLAEIGGSVAITSQPDEGTRVTLRIPLTRLTTQGVVVRVGQLQLASPVADVERTLTVRREDISMVDGVEVTTVEGGLVPVSHLGAMLSLPGDRADVMPGLVVSDGRRRRVLLVDEVVGGRELIVEPLSWNLRGAFGLAGTSVLEGDQVVLVLDAHELVHSAPESPGIGEVRSVEHQTAKRRVLVVDDSATTRTLEVNILRAAGYEVSSVPNGVDALFRLSEERFDLAVVDVQMPMMDGLELTRRVRATDSLKHLPVVLVTSLGDEVDKRRGAEAGADAYIVKGEFDQVELLRVVSRLL